MNSLQPRFFVVLQLKARSPGWHLLVYTAAAMQVIKIALFRQLHKILSLLKQANEVKFYSTQAAEFPTDSRTVVPISPPIFFCWY